MAEKTEQVEEIIRRMEAWRKRAMDLDKTLGWIRTELRMASPNDVDFKWKKRVLKMLKETEDELAAFLESVA